MLYIDVQYLCSIVPLVTKRIMTTRRLKAE